MNKDAILQIAKRRPFFVSKYKWSQDSLRKRTRRMLKDGLLVLVESNRDGFVYRASPATQEPNNG